MLKHLQQVTLNGWPAKDKNVMPIDVMSYYQFRAELSVIDGLIFKGERVVIRSTMRREMKEKFHQGHMGIEKS